MNWNDGARPFNKDWQYWFDRGTPGALKRWLNRERKTMMANQLATTGFFIVWWVIMAVIFDFSWQATLLGVAANILWRAFRNNESR